MGDDMFNVQIDVQISKPKGGDWRGDGTIAYQEKFSIPARGFTQIAKILGDLNDAVGNIKSAEPDITAMLTPIREALDVVSDMATNTHDQRLTKAIALVREVEKRIG